MGYGRVASVGAGSPIVSARPAATGSQDTFDDGPQKSVGEVFTELALL